MKQLRDILDRVEEFVKPGTKFERFYPLYEAPDTILFTPSHVTEGQTHVRDAVDLKRIMITVVVALIPCIFMAMYNTGYQANLAMGPSPTFEGWDYWQSALVQWLGIPFDPNNLLACLAHGAFYFLPVALVTFIVGGHLEVLFAVVRKHEINEGFLVTGMLFPLTLPATIPLWQVALGVAFGVVIGKEIFGGTGMNIFNPALMSRAFLFFAYPAQISGDLVWTAVSPANAVDGYSGATALGKIASMQTPEAVADPIHALATTWWSGSLSWMDAFLGGIPGSMGETSALACLLGAGLLCLTGVGSWRIMVSCVVGVFAASVLLNMADSQSNALMNVPFHWHLVLGSSMFALVFMATDPVSGAYTEKGKFVYGFFIGFLAILIRVVNPAYPEGWMLAILFMNLFAPLIDYGFIKANINRRLARAAV